MCEVGGRTLAKCHVAGSKCCGIGDMIEGAGNGVARAVAVQCLSSGNVVLGWKVQ